MEATSTPLNALNSLHYTLFIFIRLTNLTDGCRCFLDVLCYASSSCPSSTSLDFQFPINFPQQKPVLSRWQSNSKACKSGSSNPALPPSSKPKCPAQPQKYITLRIIGPSYRGVWICIAGFRDVQTPSWEIP